MSGLSVVLNWGKIAMANKSSCEQLSRRPAGGERSPAASGLSDAAAAAQCVIWEKVKQFSFAIAMRQDLGVNSDTHVGGDRGGEEPNNLCVHMP